jgi:hypothetical protein
MNTMNEEQEKINQMLGYFTCKSFSFRILIYRQTLKFILLYIQTLQLV